MLSSNCGHLSRPQCWYEFEIYKFQITIAFSLPWPKKLQNCYYKPFAYYDPLFQISKLSTACPRQCPWSTCDNDYWQQVLYSSTHHGPHTCHQMAPPQPSSSRKGGNNNMYNRMAETVICLLYWQWSKRNEPAITHWGWMMPIYCISKLTHWGRVTHIYVCVGKLTIILVQIMACRLNGVKPLSEPVLEYC